MRGIDGPQRPIAEPASQEIVAPVRDDGPPARHQHSADLAQGAHWIRPVVERTGRDDDVKGVRGEWKLSYVTRHESYTRRQLRRCLLEHRGNQVKADEVRCWRTPLEERR